MAAWWPNTGGHMTAGFPCHLQICGAKYGTESSWKIQREREMKLLPSILFPNSPFPEKALSELRMRHPWSHQKILLDEGPKNRLCQVVAPCIFSLIIYTDRMVGNATKTAQDLCSLPRQRTSQGPCSESLLWLPGQVSIWSWVLNDSADAPIKSGRDSSFSEISAGCLVRHHP